VLNKTGSPQDSPELTSEVLWQHATYRICQASMACTLDGSVVPLEHLLFCFASSESRYIESTVKFDIPVPPYLLHTTR